MHMNKIQDLIQNIEPIQKIRKLKRQENLYLVGGAIRDIALGLQTNDYDFAVTGSGIKFARYVAQRLKGAFVLLSREDDEARVIEDNTVFDFIGLGKKNIGTDLLRRDFTINAMAVDLHSMEVYDPFDGMKDLRKGIVRLTTNTALTADPLRVLRGFRFALELNFSLHKDFFKLAKQTLLKKTAAERIGYELMRIMTVPFSFDAIQKMNDLGIFLQIFPEAKKIIGDPELWEHSLQTYYAIERLMREGFFFKELKPEFQIYFSNERHKPLVKIAGLFHDIAKPDTFLLKQGEVHFYGHDTKGARTIEMLGYKRLKLSRNDVTIIRKLVKEHMRPHLLATNSELTDRAIRRFFRNLGEDYLGSMMIAWADGYATAGKTKHLEGTFRRMIQLKRADDAKPKVERLVNGYDLIALGLKPGPIYKVILQELLDLQLEGKIKTKEEGMQAAGEILKKMEEK